MTYIFCCYIGQDIAILVGYANPIIWQAWRLHFGTMGAILAAWGHLGGPWEQQEGHVGVRNQMMESTP